MPNPNEGKDEMSLPEGDRQTERREDDSGEQTIAFNLKATLALIVKLVAGGKSEDEALTEAHARFLGQTEAPWDPAFQRRENNGRTIVTGHMAKLRQLNFSDLAEVMTWLDDLGTAIGSLEGTKTSRFPQEGILQIFAEHGLMPVALEATSHDSDSISRYLICGRLREIEISGCVQSKYKALVTRYNTLMSI